MNSVNLESTTSLRGEFTVNIIREDEVIATAKTTNALSAQGKQVARKGIFADISGSLPYIGCARVYYRQYAMYNGSLVIAKSWGGWNQAVQPTNTPFISGGAGGARQVDYQFNWSAGTVLGQGHAGIVGTWNGYPSHTYKGFWWPPSAEYSNVQIGNSTTYSNSKSVYGNYFYIQLAHYYTGSGGYAGPDLVESGGITQFTDMNERPSGGDQQEGWPIGPLTSINGQQDSMEINYRLTSSGFYAPWDWTTDALNGMLQEFMSGNSSVKSSQGYVTIMSPSEIVEYGRTETVDWNGAPNFVNSGHTGTTGVINTTDTITPIFRLHNSAGTVLATKTSTYGINYYNGQRVRINWAVNAPN